jgi:hypothetical protein
MALRWRSECLFDRPAFTNTTTNRVRVDSVFASPVCNVFGFTVMRQHLDMRAVARLLQPCSPSNIAWFVVSFVVYPVDAMFGRRPNTNILIESKKRISPTITNRDASAAVSAIERILWVVAAVFHHCPTTMFRRISETIGPFSKAPARFRGPSTQSVSRYCSCVATLAFAKPLSFASLRHPVPSNNSEFAVNIARLVFCKFRCRICGSHLKLLQSFIVVRAAWRLQSSGCSYYYAMYGRAVQ